MTKDNSSCRHPMVTIVQRVNNKFILNVDELAGIVKQFTLGVQIVEMERMTIREQLQVIRCTDVLVAVQVRAILAPLCKISAIYWGVAQ